MRSQRAFALAAAATLAAGGVAACGGPITAQHSWEAVVEASQHTSSEQTTPAGGGIVYVHKVLSGQLVDGPQEHALPRTTFREDCAYPLTSSGPFVPPGRTLSGPPATCLLLVNTSRKIYQAGGKSQTPYGTFTSTGKGGGTLTLRLLKIQTIGSKTTRGGRTNGPVQDETDYLVRITAKP